MAVKAVARIPVRTRDMERVAGGVPFTPSCAPNMAIAKARMIGKANALVLEIDRNILRAKDSTRMPATIMAMMTAWRTAAAVMELLPDPVKSIIAVTMAVMIAKIPSDAPSPLRIMTKTKLVRMDRPTEINSSLPDAFCSAKRFAIKAGNALE